MAAPPAAPVPLITDRPWAALGLVVGPVAFVTAWALGGARTPGYSAIDDAISRIAAAGAPQRGLMTAGFVIYGASLLVGSQGLRRSPLSRCWVLAAINGAATLGVALTPLEHSATVDLLHGITATVGYVSISALPLVSAPVLARLGRRRAAQASVAIGIVSAACLVGTTLTEANGAFQRAGLTAGDVWLVATGVALFRSSRRSPAPR